jgi:ribosome biogenesis GTPase A
MNIVWYPGHMVKTRREITESLKMIDVVIELIDARIPISSRNPDLDSLIGNKPKVVLLNKCDLADENATKTWIRHYKQKGVNALEIDSLTGKNLNKVYNIVRETVKEMLDRKIAKGIIGRPVRAMVVGIPNVGKSSFINKIAARQIAKTGDKPGVTRTRQWIKVSKEFELLDTPGILWPKFDDITVAHHLAYTRAIKDEVLDTEELAIKFVEEVAALKPEVLKNRYKIELKTDINDIIYDIGKRRGCIIAGGEIDFLRTSIIILDDYRSGKLGKITFELPEAEAEAEAVTKPDMEVATDEK